MKIMNGIKDFNRFMRHEFIDEVKELEVLKMVFQKGHKGHKKKKEEETVEEESKTVPEQKLEENSEDFSSRELEDLKRLAAAGFYDRPITTVGGVLQVFEEFKYFQTLIAKLNYAIEETKKEEKS